ncbi:MAG: hypothetical protein J7497_11945 [Chitinophagaceae bacterium]|nr:hypothetical protein [Chitinophagaceae bacterium]
MKNKCILLALCWSFSLGILAQNPADMQAGQKYADVRDSLKNVDYPYLLPIWGKKVVQKGFKIPKSAGFSVQYLYQQSDILITDLKVGFNNGPQYDLAELVRFNSAVATSNGVNFRPDFWLFPFLNVYGLFAKSKTSTAIDAGLWIPDSSDTWSKIADINTKKDFDATTYGFGITPTVGVRGYFIILDMNFSWSDISELDQPAFVSVFGPRIGKNITWPKHPEKSWAIWVGGFRVKLNSSTSGNIKTSDIFPVNEWGQKIENGTARVAESQQKVDTWWDGLTPTEQKNPVNIAKHETADAALAKAGNILNAASQAVTNAANSTIQYSLNKTPKDKWNFLIGTQFQLNRSWMIRAEYGFLSSRVQLIAGLQYRFDF